MSELPLGWEWTTLYDVATWGSGGTPKRTVPGSFGGDIPWAVIGDLNDGIVTDTAETITEEALSCSSAKLVPKDTILLAMYGSIGKLGIAGRAMATNQAIAFAKPHHGVVHGGYLFHYLYSQRQALASVGKGATQKNISQTVLRTWPIPVPPLREQERIVTAVEEFLSRAKFLTSSLRDLARRIVVFRESSIERAFDASWPRVPLESVLERFSDCPHHTPKYSVDGTHPALRPRDVVNGVLNLKDAARVDAKEYALQTSRDAPDGGDVIYSRELSYGWASVVPPGTAVCLSQGMVLMKPAAVSGAFLAAFLNSFEGRRHAHRAATGSAHPHLNLRDIRQYPIPVVSDELQAQVLAQIGAAHDASRRLSSAVELALTRLAVLRSSILTVAFSGQLVPQDPDDEPALELLERILADRMAAPSTKRTRKAKAS